MSAHRKDVPIDASFAAMAERASKASEERGPPPPEPKDPRPAISARGAKRAPAWSGNATLKVLDNGTAVIDSLSLSIVLSVSEVTARELQECLGIVGGLRVEIEVNRAR